jgi:hypothetical protein
MLPAYIVIGGRFSSLTINRLNLLIVSCPGKNRGHSAPGLPVRLRLRKRFPVTIKVGTQPAVVMMGKALVIGPGHKEPGEGDFTTPDIQG